MLLGNYTVNNANPGREIGSAYTNPYQFLKGGTMMNWLIGEQYDATQTLKNSLPTGTESPYSYCLSVKGGELSTTLGLRGSGSITSALTQGINLEATLTGSGTLQDALLSLITSMEAALNGSGSLSGSMVGTVALVATIAGTGSVTAGLNLISGLSATLTGSGDITADLKGTANLEAHIFVNSGSATTQEIVDGVWEALAADHDNPGTMGEKMNDAGSAGDPWNTDLSTYTTSGTAGKVLKDKLSTTNFIALK